MQKQSHLFGRYLIVGIAGIIALSILTLMMATAPSHSTDTDASANTRTKRSASIHLTKREKKVASKYKLTKLQTRTASKIPITAIGDSVMLDVKPNIKQAFRHSAVSGSVGRQFYSLPKIVRNLKAHGHLGQYIVINLGTNGPPTQADINSVLKTVGQKRQIFWINTRVPRHWQATTNRLIAKNAQKHANVHVVNWYKASKGHSGWFARDRVHVDLTGARYYTRELVKKVSDVSN